MPKIPRVHELLQSLQGEHKTAQVQVQQTLVSEQVQITEHGKRQETHTQTHITEQATQKQDQKAPTRTRVDTAIETETIRTVAQDGSSTTLSRVHATTAGTADLEMTPPHPPREDTPIYMRTHHHLVFTLDRPCMVCGVRKSTLDDPQQNPFGAQHLETHHHPLERCLLNACDPAKVGRVFPAVKDRATLEEFVDSEANMLVLCDIHHRHPFYGIHHVVGPDFFAQPFVFDGYQVMSDKEHEAEVAAADEKIVKAHLTAQEIAFGEGIETRIRSKTAR